VIILVIVLILAAGTCTCGEPTPSEPVPRPSPCTSVVLCASSCDGVATTACAPCPAGTFDISFCGVDGGPPLDGGSCDDVPCTVPSECAYACDEEPFYVGCCDCPFGTIDQRSACSLDAGPLDAGPRDAGPLDGSIDASDAGDARVDTGGGLLAVGESCFDDRQCSSGLCYGTADASGAFAPPTCQAMCLPVDDRGHWCRNDRHCCEGACCLGCGELEGLCRVTSP
jgi:hypothetical protein